MAGYSLLVIVVVVLALWRGWCKGFIHQFASLLGLAFGLVGARILSGPVGAWIQEKWPDLGTGITAEATYDMLGSVVAFTVIYLALHLLARVLQSAMSVLHVGALNAIAGSAFAAAKWVFLLSVIFNFIICISPRGSLMKACTAGDANICELVVAVAPALLGTEGPDEIEHRQRIEEARAIDSIYSRPAPPPGYAN